MTIAWTRDSIFQSRSDPTARIRHPRAAVPPICAAACAMSLAFDTSAHGAGARWRGDRRRQHYEDLSHPRCTANSASAPRPWIRQRRDESPSYHRSSARRLKPGCAVRKKSGAPTAGNDNYVVARSHGRLRYNRNRQSCPPPPPPALALLRGLPRVRTGPNGRAR